MQLTLLAILCVGEMLFPGATKGQPFRRAASSAAMLATQESPLVAREQIVFLYYKDLEFADTFFGMALGLKKTKDLDWVKIFQTVPGSSIGCVKEGRGSLKTSADKPVMVSWVVDDVEVWHRRLTANHVKIVKPIHVSNEPPMKSLLFEDPTGYTFELVQWVKLRP
jgi:predicted enzyme related to lactoylglutathione lyase